MMKSIKIKVPLFWKFSLAIIIIVLVFGTINSVLIYHNVKSSLEEETKKRALFIANSIARQVTSSALFEDYISIQNIINGIKEIDSNISYIFILDNKNDVVVHTFEGKFPVKLIGINNVSDGLRSYGVQTFKLMTQNSIDSDGELIIDIAVPLLSGRVGTIRVGLKESTIQRDVENTVNVFWIMVAVFLIFGIVGAFAFAMFITKPIKSIQNVADKVSLSDIGKQDLPKINIREKFLGKIRTFVRAEDEIDVLANRFNDMIDRLEKAYRDLQNAQDTLIQSEKLATVGTLTAGLAHEINNPLAGLQNCIRRIKSAPEKVDQNKKYLLLMEKAVEKIENVVRSLLNFSRRQQSLELNKLFLPEVIESALLLVGHRLEKLRVSFTQEIQPNLPPIRGNRNLLEQVFLNIFINSLDSIEEKTHLDQICERRLIVRGVKQSPFVKIEIEDSGNGIPTEIIDRVFDPFFTTKLPGKGTGLGLAVVYHIIALHKGKIYFQSEEGKGTVVTMEIPIMDVDLSAKN